MIFNVTKYESNTLDETIRLEFETMIEGKPKTEHCVCPDKASAESKIIIEKQKALAKAVQNWIHNKKEIIEKGADRKNLKKLYELAEVKRIMEPVYQSELKRLCKAITGNHGLFRKILPHPLNNQYEAAENRLEEIIAFAYKESITDFKTIAA
jgi:hypothetical protein